MHRLPLLTGLVALFCFTGLWLTRAGRDAADEVAAGAAPVTASPAEAIAEPLVRADEGARRSAAAALEPSAEDSAAPPAGEPDLDEPPEEGEEAVFNAEALLADIGLPKGAPVALLIDRVGPPDPLESGAASVRLTLFDRESGAAVASPVILWRLAAPGNEYWLSGDQAVAHERGTATGWTFDGLPAGEYRAVCTAELRGAPDPPAFFVGGDTEAALFLTMPGERPVRLELSAAGERVTRAEMLFGPVECIGVVPHAPGWVHQRELRDPPDGLFDESFESANGFPFSGEWVTLLAGPDGFDLGALPEDRRDGRWERSIDLRVEGAVPTRIMVRNDAPGDVLRLTAEVPGA